MPITHRLTFLETSCALREPITKFGGQPAWLSEPVIPLSRRTTEPMTFVCQVAIPRDWHVDGLRRMAYVFMTGAGFDHRAMETWSPDEGETRVVIQLERDNCKPLGPYPNTLRKWQEQGGTRTEVPCEFAVHEDAENEAAYLSQDALDHLPESDRERIVESWRGNKIGGSPYWIQDEEFPFQDWHLLLQLEDGGYPFNLNLGTGVGYVFLNSECTEGKLLWQC